MTDNSAEREAEQILQEAWNEARAEECPQGDQCPVHFRVNEVFFDEDDERYARLITYVGDYAVVTEDNHKLGNPELTLGIVLGVVKREDLPPRWETTILHVGSGVIADLELKSNEDILKEVRYAREHDNWDEIQGVHDTTVMFLKSNLIDVSKPWEG